MTATQAIKEYFEKDDTPPGTGPARPLTNGELLGLRKADIHGYDELGQLCAAALGKTIDN